MTILLLMTFALAAIFVIVQEPGWYRALMPEQHAPKTDINENGGMHIGSSPSTEWVLPAIGAIVVIGGVSLFLVLNKPTR